MSTNKFVKGKSGNPNGRPKGTRNKTAIQKAQDLADAKFSQQVQMWQAVSTRDPVALEKYGLKPSDIKPKDMIDASKQLAALVSAKNQVLGDPVPEPAKKPTEQKPTFSPSASSVTPLRASASA